jgi:hypothetical protein
MGTRQGEEAGWIFDTGGKFMNGLFFMGQEAGTDTVLCKAAVIVLVFKPEQSDFGSSGTAGKQEDAEAEQDEEELWYDHNA